MERTPSSAWFWFRAFRARVGVLTRPSRLLSNDLIRTGSEIALLHRRGTFSMLLARRKLFSKECASDVNLLPATCPYTSCYSDPRAVDACSERGVHAPGRRVGSNNCISTTARRRRDKSGFGNVAHHCAAR